MIDAIDESKNRSCVMYALQGIAETFPALKVLISRREERQIVDIFQAWTFPRETSTRIRQNDVADDIFSFVKSEVTARARDGKPFAMLQLMEPTECESTSPSCLLQSSRPLFLHLLMALSALFKRCGASS